MDCRSTVLFEDLGVVCTLLDLQLTLPHRISRTSLVAPVWTSCTPRLDANATVEGESTTIASLHTLANTTRSFVEFETSADLKTAVEKLDQQDFKGQTVTCVADVSFHKIRWKLMLIKQPRNKQRLHQTVAALVRPPLAAVVVMAMVLATHTTTLVVLPVVTALAVTTTDAVHHHVAATSTMVDLDTIRPLVADVVHLLQTHTQLHHHVAIAMTRMDLHPAATATSHTVTDTNVLHHVAPLLLVHTLMAMPTVAANTGEYYPSLHCVLSQCKNSAYETRSTTMPLTPCTDGTVDEL
jgi:hypothetical protein